MRRPESDWWPRTLALYSGRLATAVLSVLRRLARELLSGLDAIPIDQLLAEVLRRLNVTRWTRELRTAVRAIIYAAVAVGAVDELDRHRGYDRTRQAGERSNAYAAFLVAGTAWESIVLSIRNATAKVVRGTGDVLVKLRNLFRSPALVKRAERIGETEAHGAIQGGKYAARLVLFPEGYLNAQEWNTMGDERVRHTHEDAEGQVVGIGEFFRVGGSLARFPGDPGLPLREKIGCRCWATAMHLEPEELAKRRDRLVVARAFV